MKTLSVKQPWAYLICAGIKDIENRPRRTHFRGRILIHASAKAYTYDYPEKFFTPEQYKEIIDKTKDCVVHCETSAIIGSVEIIDCVENHPSIWAVVGQFHYVLANPVLFDKPILGVKGQLGLWNYEFPEDTYECTNDNPFSHQSCGESIGCIQNCDDCDYWKSVYE